MSKRIEFGCRNSSEAVKPASEWLASFQDNFTVYGGGMDFNYICSSVPGFRERIDSVIDDSGAPGTISIAAALTKNPAYIFVCSKMHQEAMCKRLEKSGFAGTLVTVFAGSPDIGTAALFAYNPAEDWPVFTEVHKPNLKRKRPERIRKILLVQPPFSNANNRHKRTMPLSLLYIAASIHRAFPEIELKLFDAHVKNTSWTEMKDFIRKTDFDMLLCSAWSAQIDAATLISSFVIHEKKSWLVLGGVHATLAPEKVVDYADFIAGYEGEDSINHIIDAINMGCPESIPKLSGSEYIEDLDSIPFPLWEILEDYKLYNHPMHVVGGLRFPIIGSRGCPFNCSFCSSPLFWKRKVRWRSPANIVDEMDEIFKRYGVSNFHFWDDNFIMNKKFASGMASELMKRKRAYKWCGLSRASDIIKNSNLLPELRKAGCVGIEIGVESFTDQAAEMLDKGETVSDTIKAARLLREADIHPLYTHMLFTPGETIKSYIEKEKFLRENNSGLPAALRSDSTLGQLTTPHIKTPFATEAPEMGLVLWRGPRDSYHHRVNFLPNTLLDEIPVKVSDEPPETTEILSKILQSVFDWTESDMKLFAKICPLVWTLINGTKSVRELAGTVTIKLDASFERCAAMTCLYIALLARAGHINSKS